MQEKVDQLFSTYRPLLFTLAYQMLGSIQDAEDIVQDTYITLNRLEISRIKNMKSYLCKIVTNKCIDYLKSARKKRETYVGPWLPEPMISDNINENDPVQYYVQKESISTAYLLLLEQLSETERAVFLLREVLEYEYEDIAEIIGKSSTNCRQIFHRAKKALGNPKETKRISLEKANAITDRFVSAIFNGNVKEILNLLSVDTTLYSDGGGKTKSAIYPITGSERVARFCMGILAKTSEGISMRRIVANGEPGMVIYLDKQVHGVITFQFENETIKNIYFVVNPEKLLTIN